jgi:hypothetical protein
MIGSGLMGFDFGQIDVWRNSWLDGFKFKVEKEEKQTV